MSYLDITFTGRNPFSNAQVRAGVEAASAVFARHGVEPADAFARTMERAEEGGSSDPVWSEADLAAARAMCQAADCDLSAAENATLELVGG